MRQNRVAHVDSVQRQNIVWNQEFHRKLRHQAGRFIFPDHKNLPVGIRWQSGEILHLLLRRNTERWQRACGKSGEIMRNQEIIQSHTVNESRLFYSISNVFYCVRSCSLFRPPGFETHSFSAVKQETHILFWTLKSDLTQSFEKLQLEADFFLEFCSFPQFLLSRS